MLPRSSGSRQTKLLILITVIERQKLLPNDVFFCQPGVVLLRAEVDAPGKRNQLKFAVATSQPSWSARRESIEITRKQ